MNIARAPYWRVHPRFLFLFAQTRHRNFAVLSALLLAAVLAQTDSQSVEEDRAVQVARLVRQLDASESEKREAAEKELMAIGTPALGSLPDTADGSPEMAERLKRIREALEKRAAEQSTRGSTISISGKMTLEELRASLEKQTGNKIVDYRARLGQRESNPQLAMEVKNAPFWQALDIILDKTNLGVYPFSGRDGLALQEREPGEPDRSKRATYAGPLRLEVNRLVAERRPAVEAGTLSVNLQIAWEPRLEPIMFLQPLKEVRAIDDQGNALKVEGNDTLEAPSQGGTGIEFVLPFIAPPHTATSIVSLKGTLTAILPGKVESFEFTKLGDAQKPRFKPVEQKKAAAHVTLEQVRKNNEIWEVLVRVKFDDAGGSLESHRGWILENEAFLIGADKKPIEKAGMFSTVRSPSELGVGYQFEASEPIDSYTFVYKSASSISSVSLPYELKNLPLP
jgi:hypothetical protein